MSEHISVLDSETIPFPGYHPHTLNDEIHNDFFEQNIFEHEDDELLYSPNDGLHGELKRKVIDQKLWYLVIHDWELASNKEIEIYNRETTGYIHLYYDEEYRIVYGNETVGYFTKKTGNVLLFAVGLSKDRKHLIGYVSSQICHNLCD